MAKKQPVKKPKQTILESPPQTTASFRFKPKNDEQAKAWQEIASNDYTFLTGIAGSGKTTVAISYAVEHYKDYEKIVIARPAVESGESLGFLPGDLSQKLNPYLVPVFEAIGKSTKNSTELKERIGAMVETVPLAYARGRTFENTFVVLDEAQNADAEAIEMFITRLGEGSKMVLCGDDGQPDIVRCVLGDVAKAFYDAGQAGWCQFTRSVRHPRIAKAIEIMSQFKGKRR